MNLFKHFTAIMIAAGAFIWSAQAEVPKNSPQAVLKGSNISINDNGCFAVEPSCLIVSRQFIRRGPSEEQGQLNRRDAYGIVLRNKCAGRVYVKACMPGSNGSPGCDRFGIEEGKGRRYGVSGASGPYEVQYWGSRRVSQDWVCRDTYPAGRLSGVHLAAQ